MSRSIHRTRRDWRHETRWRHPDEEYQQDRLDKIGDDIWKKRRLKRKAAWLRKQEERPLYAPPQSPESIPICIVDEDPHLHYHASPEDVRGVLGMLPPGTLTGVTTIEFRRGRGACEELVLERGNEDEYEPDPFLARRAVESIPGIYFPPLLGRYDTLTGRIWILGNVHGPLPETPPGLALYQRLRQLATLVHELAHHDDMMLRVWRPLDVMSESRRDDGEAYAVEMEKEWSRQVVAPYLERAYPEEVHAWEQWMAKTIGIPVTLRILADLLDLFWTPAYEDFLTNVLSGRDPLETRLEFADGLHYNFRLNVSLALTQAIRRDHPEDLGAMALEADVLEHLDRLDEAQERVTAVLRRDARHERAWQVQILLHRKRRAWPELADSARRARSTFPDRAASFADEEALAYIHLGNEIAFAQCLEVLRTEKEAYYHGLAARFEVLMQLHLGEYEEVLRLADAANPGLPRGAIANIELFRALAQRRLGRGSEPIQTRRWYVNRLCSEGFDEWADEVSS